MATVRQAPHHDVERRLTGGILACLLLLLSFALIPAPATGQGQVAAPDFTLDSPLLYIPYGQKDTTQSFVPLRLTGQPTGETPQLEDGDTSLDGPQVTFAVGNFVQLDSGPGWLMTVSVKNADRVVSEQARFVIIRYGNKIYRKAYKLQPATVGAANLIVSPPIAEWPWSGKNAQSMPIQVTLGSAVARNVHLVTSGVQDAKSKQVIASGFQLCKDGTCGDTIPELRGPGVFQLSIQPPQTQPAPGVYEGTFGLAADGQSSPASFNVKFDATSWPARILGILLIIGGTLMGLFLTYVLSAEAAALQAARPAALVAARVKRTADDLAAINSQYPSIDTHETSDALKKAAESLDDTALRAFGLRRGWWAQLRSIAVPLDSTGLSAHVDAQSKRAAMLDVLAKRGIAAALVGVDAAAMPEDVKKAVGDLDALAARSDIADAATMLSAVQTILANLAASHGAISAISLNRTAAYTSWSVDQIEADAATVGNLWLVVAGILTATIGAYVMVFTNPGFGRAEDLILCALWGLGFSTGAGAIPSMNLNQIRTTIALPKPV